MINSPSNPCSSFGMGNIASSVGNGSSAPGGGGGWDKVGCIGMLVVLAILALSTWGIRSCRLHQRMKARERQYEEWKKMCEELEKENEVCDGDSERDTITDFGNYRLSPAENDANGGEKKAGVSHSDNSHSASYKNHSRSSGHSYSDDGYDEDGYDEDGYDKDGYDSRGYDRDGYDRDGYDEEGFDEEGYDGEGYDEDENYSEDW